MKQVKQKLSIPEYVDIYFESAQLRNSMQSANYFLSEMKRNKVSKKEFLQNIKLVQSIAEQLLENDKNRTLTKKDILEEIMSRLNGITKVLNDMKQENA